MGTNIPTLPEHFAEAPGVVMNPPPAELMAETVGVIGKALSSLRDEERGKLVWIASKQGDTVAVNLAFAQRVGDHVKVTAWLGKTWGHPIAAGIAGDISW